MPRRRGEGRGRGRLLGGASGSRDFLRYLYCPGADFDFGAVVHLYIYIICLCVCVCVCVCVFVFLYDTFLCYLYGPGCGF
jgi:hypothetical protein